MVRNLSYILIGGLVGAVAMWLTASKSGEENRLMLRDSIRDAQHRANTALGEAQTKASMAMDEAQTKARRITDAGRRVVEEQKSTLEHGVEEIKSAAKGDN